MEYKARYYYIVADPFCLFYIKNKKRSLANFQKRQYQCINRYMHYDKKGGENFYIHHFCNSYLYRCYKTNDYK